MKIVKFLPTMILVFIFILPLLHGIFSNKFHSQIDKAKHDVTKPKMKPIEAAIETYKKNTGQLPKKLEDLVYVPPGLENEWQGPYLRKSQIYDPWDRLYIYELNSADPNSYLIISYGKDGRIGGQGYNSDIYN